MNISGDVYIMNTIIAEYFDYYHQCHIVVFKKGWCKQEAAGKTIEQARELAEKLINNG